MRPMIYNWGLKRKRSRTSASIKTFWKSLTVATRALKDLTGRKIYACLVSAAMHLELFKRVHVHDAGHFGYAKIYPIIHCSVNTISGTEWRLTIEPGSNAVSRVRAPRQVKEKRATN